MDAVILALEAVVDLVLETAEAVMDAKVNV